MAIPGPAARRAFVRRHTRLQDVPEVPGLRLHLGDDVTAVWGRSGEFLATRRSHAQSRKPLDTEATPQAIDTSQHP